MWISCHRVSYKAVVVVFGSKSDIFGGPIVMLSTLTKPHFNPQKAKKKPPQLFH